MLRDLLKEGGLYALTNLMTKGISLFLIPFYTVYFSPSDYGVIDLLNLFTLFIIGIFSLQLNQGLARYVAEPTLQTSQKISYASTAIWFAVALLLGITLILFFFPEKMILALSSGDFTIERMTYQLAVWTIFLNGMFYLLGVHLRFLRMSKAFALLSFIHALSSIILILVFVLAFDFGIKSIYLSYLIIVPPLLCAQFHLLRRDIAFTFNAKALNKLLIFSVPLIPAAVATMIMNFADRLYIKEYLDFNQLGIYAMAGKFSSIVGLIVAGFTMAITPIIFQKHHETNTKAQLSRIFKMYLAVGTFGVLGLSLFSKEIVTFVTNERFHSAAFVMPLMLYTAFFVGISMFSQGLNIQKKTILTAILVIIFASLNIVLNQLLVPIYGQMGAACATLIATSLYNLSVFRLSMKYYDFDYPIFQFGLVLLLSTALIMGIIYWQPEISFETAFLKLGILIFFGIILRTLKLFTFKRIVNYINQRRT